MSRLKIISGAQSGVDQAALDAAIKNNINYSGYMPSSGAENFNVDKLKKKYPKLFVTISKDPAIRTVLNVQTSDILLNIMPYWMSESPGTNLGVELSVELNKPAYNLRHFNNKELDNVIQWIKNNSFDYLKIGVNGPRESQCAECYNLTYNFLNELFMILKKW